MTSIKATFFNYSAEEKAELFNKYFCSQSFIDDSCACLPTNISYFQTTIILSNIHVTEGKINYFLKNVDVSVKLVVLWFGNRIYI